MFFSFFLVLFAIIVVRLYGWASWLQYVLAASIVGTLFLTCIQLGLTAVTGEGINGAVFYHLKTGLTGGDISQYFGPITLILGILVGLLSALWRWRDLLLPAAVRQIYGVDVAVVVFAFSAIAIHPVSLASAQYALRFSLAEQQTEGFEYARIDPTAPKKPRNLVILYLESLERTYMDESRFPDLTPNLTALENRSVSFTDLGQMTGANFTVGGMVATQCGAPLILSGGENSMKVSSFLSGATCLGDIFGHAGYTLSYLGGASTAFAGKGAFYRTHGYDEVTGLEELLPNLPEPGYRAEWGIQDDTLFEIANERFDRLTSEAAPFVLSILTLDTHHPNGHAETNRACKGLTYGDGANPMLNSVLCADYLAGQFVERILQGPDAEDTVIAVMSDHLAMVNSATNLLEDGSRRNLLMLIDGAQTDAPRRVDRPGTTLDIGPTLLSYLGFDVPVMGLGVDLLGEEQTMPEVLGVDSDDSPALDAHVMGYQAAYERLWEFPDISNGLYINSERGELQFGHSVISIPALLAFDSENAIVSATLGDPTANETLTEAAFGLDDGTRYLWIDVCEKLAFESSLMRNEDLCTLVGRRGDSVRTAELKGSRFQSPEALAELLASWEDDTQAEREVTALERIGAIRGDLPIEGSLADLDTGDRGILVQSSGFGFGATFVRRQTIDTLTAGEDVLLERGLTLVGVAASGSSEILDRLDQCDEKFDGSGHRSWADQMLENEGEFVAHLVVVHDSAFCSVSADKLVALDGLYLPKLRAINPREPYVAVIDAAGVGREFSHRNAGRTKVYLTPGYGSDAFPVISGSRFLPLVQSGELNSAQSGMAADTSPVSNESLPLPKSAEEVNRTSLCEGPVSGAEQGSLATIRPSSRLSGTEMYDFVRFTSGWWEDEPDGRWSGSLSSSIALVLPEEPIDLQLMLGLATPNDRGRELRVFHAGRELASASLNGYGDVVFDVGDLPRATLIELNIEIDGTELSCPFERSGKADKRRNGVMLQSIALSPDLGAPSDAGLRLSTLGSANCIFAGEGWAYPQVKSSLSSNVVMSVAEALNAEAIALKSGWWEPEDFGIWTGEKSAEFELTLPEGSGELQLELTLAAFRTDDVEVQLSYEGQVLVQERVGVGKPLVADVSALPRGESVSLALILFDPFEPNCPALFGAGDDTRTLGVMLQGLRLTRFENTPFASAIAHGGGRLNAEAITNSFEALNANRPRFEVFEIDLSWTADGELVCLHDWQESYTYRFGSDTVDPIKHGRFRQLLAMSPERPRNCDLDGLAGWLQANADVRIVTDVKDRPFDAYKLIAERYPDLITQFVPQAYQPVEIDQFRSLGFQDVIWTLYRYGGDPEAVVREANRYSPAAVTMPVSMAKGGLLDIVVEATRLPVYVHTINTRGEAACLLAAGAAGVYSDDLGEADVVALRNATQDCFEMGSSSR